MTTPIGVLMFVIVNKYSLPLFWPRQRANTIHYHSTKRLNYHRDWTQGSRWHNLVWFTNDLAQVTGAAIFHNITFNALLLLTTFEKHLFSEAQKVSLLRLI